MFYELKRVHHYPVDSERGCSAVPKDLFRVRGFGMYFLLSVYKFLRGFSQKC